MAHLISRNSTARTTRWTAFLLLALLSYLSLGCAVSASGIGSSALQQSQNEESTGTIQAKFFGMVIESSTTEPAVVMGSRRLWDSGVTWAALEPSPGSFAWTTLDEEVEAATEQGAQVMLTLGMTPAWASSQPELASSYGAGATAMPANLADWDAYVSAVATRYKGRIEAYEVWNAPENTAYWSGAQTQMGQNMATLADHAARIIHAADSAAVVVSPALSPGGLAAFVAAGGGSVVDAVGSSLDGATEAPETMTATLAALHSAMAGTAAAGKPVWNEQASWVLPQGGLSADLQADYVARALVLNAGYGVARMHWYAWDEGVQGALALTDAQRKPTEAGQAYGVVEGWLEGAQMNGCAADAAGVWSCQLVSNGRTEWIVWSPDGDTQSSTLGASTGTDLAGNVSAVDASGLITVGASPVLLR